MDKTAFTNQGILWYIRKRSKDTNMDSYFDACAYCIGKKRRNLDITLYTFLQILSVSIFEKVDILQLITNSAGTIEVDYTCNQLNLFDL